MKYIISKDQNNFYHIICESLINGNRHKTRHEKTISFFHTYEDAINEVQRLIKEETQ